MSKTSIFRFHRRYFGLALALFLIELFIALYVKDRFIRPILGDVLVVVFLYTLVRAFVTLPKFQVAVGVLTFAFLVEISQWFNLVKLLGLEHSKIAKVVLGQSFDWKDLLAYTIGVVIVYWLDVRKGWNP